MKKASLKLLINLGLTETEARVYLAGITLGPATVSSIAQKANVKRTTVYPAIRTLKKKGLMSVDIHGMKKSM